jgi:phospholipid transport system substrate-binding protein
MAREVLGKYWRRADARQRSRFQAAFRQLLIDDYATVFRQYADQTVEYLPVHPAVSGDRAMVSMEVDTPGEQRVRVDYHLHRVGAGWLIYDVQIDGVSLLINYRETFSEQLRSDSLAALLASVEQKNASFHIRSPR